MRKLSIEQVGDAKWQTGDTDGVAYKEISLRIVGAQYDDSEGVDNFITIRAEANDEKFLTGNKITISTTRDHLSPESIQNEYYGSLEELKAAWTATVNAVWFGLEHTISRQMVYGETYRRDSLRTLKG